METIVYTNIRKMRLGKNFTQEYMAEQLSISQTYYSKIERGRKDITLAQLLKIGGVLNLNPQKLFDL